MTEEGFAQNDGVGRGRRTTVGKCPRTTVEKDPGTTARTVSFGW
jgi:hypothetical protein